LGSATRNATPQAPCTELHGRYRRPKELAQYAKNPGKTRVFERRGQDSNYWLFSLCFVIVRKMQLGRSNLAKIPAAGHLNCTNPLQAQMYLFRFGPTHDRQTQVLPSWYLVLVSVAIPS
jgi:hypothetical protein